MDEFQKELDCTILACICSEFSSIPQNSCPRNVVCNLIGNSVFADVIRLRISKRNTFDLEWVLKPMSGVLVKRGQDTGDTHTQKACEAEVEVTLPQAREHLGPPAVGRGKKGFFSRAFQGILTPLTPWLYISSLKTWESKMSVVLSHTVCDTLLWQS